MWRRTLVLLQVCVVPCLHAVAQAPRPVSLEVAPGALGDVRSTAMVFLTASASGKELYLFDAATGELTTFLESGEIWDEPVRLEDPAAGALQAKSLRMDVGDGFVLIATGQKIYRFGLDGRFLASDASFFLPSDVAALSVGELVLGLQNFPTPGGGFLRQEKLKGFEPPPRIAVVDEDFEVVDGGLPVDDEGWTSSLAAARSLRLTWSGRRIYAAEQSNYTIYELDRSLHVRDVFRDPALQFEAGPPAAAGEDPALPPEVPEAVARFTERSGRNLVTSVPAGSSAPTTTGGMFANLPVIRDIAWDSRSGRLAVLLAPGAGAPGGAIDLLDPLSGEIRRFALERSSATRDGFSQIVAGHRYLWLRSHQGENLTYRLDRQQLVEGGEKLTIPERLYPPEPPT